MRTRIVAAAAVAVLAAAGLSGCRSNVGTALVINGEHISDSQVSRYVTPKAQPVQVSQTASAAPRAFVVQILIYTRLFHELVDARPGGGPSDAQLSQVSRQALAGKSPTQFAEAQQVRGYTAGFDRVLVQYVAYQGVLRTLPQDQLPGLLKKIKISVHVSPRYGTWDNKNLSLNIESGAGLPGFVSLQPTAAAGASTASVPVPDGN